MALTIETGTGVAGANSYATVAEARTFASTRGVTLSASDPAVEVLLVKASDFMNSLESKFKGTRVSPTQALAWPRENVYLFGSTVAALPTALPACLKQAQCQLAMDAVTLDLLPNGKGREVIRQKTDVIETEYAKSGTGSITPRLNKAMALLEPVFKGGLSVQTVRV